MNLLVFNSEVIFFLSFELSSFFLSSLAPVVECALSFGTTEILLTILSLVFGTALSASTNPFASASSLSAWALLNSEKVSRPSYSERILKIL